MHIRTRISSSQFLFENALRCVFERVAPKSDPCRELIRDLMANELLTATSARDCELFVRVSPCADQRTVAHTSHHLVAEPTCAGACR